MNYQLEVLIRKIWSPLKSAKPCGREEACDLLTALRNSGRYDVVGLKFRIKPVVLEEL